MDGRERIVCWGWFGCWFFLLEGLIKPGTNGLLAVIVELAMGCRPAACITKATGATEVVAHACFIGSAIMVGYLGPG
jgi:hypothetical protein